MIVRKTLPEENDAINRLFSVAFQTSPDKGPADADNARILHWGAFSDEGELMSSLSLTSYQIRFDGQASPMAGVGAVQTLPPCRRRGGVAACFAAALPALYAEGVHFAYLYPFSTAFYRRFGFESCVMKIGCTVDLAQLRLPPEEGSFRLAVKEKPLAEAIRAVDQVWERRWNMEVLHGEEDYDWLAKLDPFTKQEYLYVCFDAAGRAIAYTAFRPVREPDGRDLVCSRFRFADREGYYALLGVFKSLAADHRFAKFALPSDPALPYLMSEWSLGAASFRLEPAGLVRVINAREVLTRAAYRGSGELRLQIRDALIAENDGVFSLRFADGHAVSVKRTEEKPDAVLDIRAFSAMIAGVCDLEGAGEWMNGVEILDPAAPLERVFYRKSMTITEPF